MNPLAKLVNAVADRIHHDSDAADMVRGLVAVTLPDGRRVVRHPGMPAVAAAYRARIAADPDVIDRMFLDDAVRAQIAVEGRRQAVAR